MASTDNNTMSPPTDNKRAASPFPERELDNLGTGTDTSKRRAVEKSGGMGTNPVALDSEGEHSQGTKNIETESVVVRAIIDSKHTGTIIGKQGSTISWIRSQSEAKVNVSDANRAHPVDERVVTVTGTCAAVFRAFSFICDKIKESQTQQAAANSTEAPPNVVTMTLAIPNMQAGAVIGKKGAKIKEIRDATGATINLDPEMLPNSTERPCVVAGSVESVAQSVFHIACTLLQVPNKGQHAPYIPGSKATSTGGPGGHFRSPQQMGFAAPVGYGTQPQYGAQQQYGGAYGSTAQAQQQLSVSNEIIGAIIGRAGSKINEIRQISQAQIKIADKVPGAPDRTIIMSGSPEAVQMAQYLISTRMQEAMMANMQAAQQQQQ
eukprot:m.132275 g.132275  ORF g.132275 m.132275 type:complete len:378 (+) comp29597_c3_seq1:256-1389(+)